MGAKNGKKHGKKHGKKKSDQKAKLLARLTAAGAIKHSLVVLANTDKNEQLSGLEEEVNVEISAEEARAWLNGVPLDLSSSGKGSADVLPGHHILSYELRGAPGTTWTVQITSPAEAKSDDGDTFDGDGFEAGRIRFVVSA